MERRCRSMMLPGSVQHHSNAANSSRSGRIKVKCFCTRNIKSDPENQTVANVDRKPALPQRIASGKRVHEGSFTTEPRRRREDTEKNCCARMRAIQFFSVLCFFSVFSVTPW